MAAKVVSRSMRLARNIGLELARSRAIQFDRSFGGRVCFAGVMSNDSASSASRLLCRYRSAPKKKSARFRLRHRRRQPARKMSESALAAVGFIRNAQGIRGEVVVE